MQVTIQVSSSLRDTIPTHLDVEQGMTVGEIVTELAIPIKEGLVILVNGRLAHWGTVLKDEDVLQLTPVPSGG